MNFSNNNSNNRMNSGYPAMNRQNQNYSNMSQNYLQVGGLPLQSQSRMMNQAQTAQSKSSSYIHGRPSIPMQMQMQSSGSVPMMSNYNNQAASYQNCQQGPRVGANQAMPMAMNNANNGMQMNGMQMNGMAPVTLRIPISFGDTSANNNNDNNGASGSNGVKYIPLEWEQMLGGKDNLRVMMSQPNGDSGNRQLRVTFQPPGGPQITGNPGETPLRVVSINPTQSLYGGGQQAQHPLQMAMTGTSQNGNWFNATQK